MSNGNNAGANRKSEDHMLVQINIFSFIPASDISMEALTPFYVVDWLGNADSGVIYVGF